MKGDGRGGARIGAGRKKQNITSAGIPGAFTGLTETPPAFTPPKPAAYMREKQKSEIKLDAARIHRETWAYLTAQKCAEYVPADLVDNYAMTAARWIQAERAISKYGLLGTHPTTGGPIPSPFVSIAAGYMRQLNMTRIQITEIVKEHGGGAGGEAPEEIMFKALLNGEE